MEKSARALEKICNPAEAGSRFFNDIVVLGADTAVVLDGAIFGKPADNREAAAMLSQLAGRSHEVLTALSLRSHGWERGTVESTTVEFSAIGPEEIEWYARSGEGLDKAGAYAIQGLASRFIPRIHGSYTNVVGLPIAAMHQLVADIASRPS